MVEWQYESNYIYNLSKRVLINIHTLNYDPFLYVIWRKNNKQHKNIMWMSGISIKVSFVVVLVTFIWNLANAENQTNNKPTIEFLI